MKQRCSRARWRERITNWKCWPALAACTLFSSTALAQKPVPMDDESRSMLPWAIGLGIIILVCGSAFLNPKRSHQG